MKKVDRKREKKERGRERRENEGERESKGERWDGKNYRGVAKKNAKENANRPLDITGEMFPDLSRFYLAACL